MRLQDAIADFIEATRQNTFRYLAGFDDTNHTKQAPNLPNHAAWNLGHCALTMHRVAERLDGKPMPESDFIPAATRGDANRFGTESVAFGSKPAADPTGYPSFARCQQVFSSACERLAAAVRAASDAKLQEMTPWGPGQSPLYLLTMRMAAHNGMHTGQIADLRRALGFKSIFS